MKENGLINNEEIGNGLPVKDEIVVSTKYNEKGDVVYVYFSV